MAIIKLTDFELKEDLYLFTKHIVYIHERKEDDGATRVLLEDREAVFVKETPEEILALIKEAENDRKN